MQEKIQGIVNPRSMVFTPIQQGISISTFYQNNSIIEANVVTNSGEPLQTEMNLPNIGVKYVIGKIENANPFRLTVGLTLGINSLGFINEQSNYILKGMYGLLIHYDGVNTYLLTHQTMNKGGGSLFVIAPIDTKVYNSQLAG